MVGSVCMQYIFCGCIWCLVSVLAASLNLHDTALRVHSLISTTNKGIMLTALLRDGIWN